MQKSGVHQDQQYTRGSSLIYLFSYFLVLNIQPNGQEPAQSQKKRLGVDYTNPQLVSQNTIVKLPQLITQSILTERDKEHYNVIYNLK